MQGRDRIIWGGRGQDNLIDLCKLLPKVLGAMSALFTNPSNPDRQWRQKGFPQAILRKIFSGIPIICLAGTDDAWATALTRNLEYCIFNRDSNSRTTFAIIFFLQHVLCHPFCAKQFNLHFAWHHFGDYKQHFIAHCDPTKIRSEFMPKAALRLLLLMFCIAVDSKCKKSYSCHWAGCRTEGSILFINFVDTEAFTPCRKKHGKGSMFSIPAGWLLLGRCKWFYQGKPRLSWL